MYFWPSVEKKPDFLDKLEWLNMDFPDAFT